LKDWRKGDLKVVLSRKGFDSSSEGGGGASPIFDDKDLLSLSIPDDEEGSEITYGSLKTSSGLSYLELIRQLKIKQWQEYTDDTRVHLDPDLSQNKPGIPDWLPTFGQSGAAEGHLRKNQVGKGDLFLFYGWFRRTVKTDQGYQYDRNDPDGRHIIWGYMEVGERKPVEEIIDDPRYDWAKQHPHLYSHRKRPLKAQARNTVYIANSSLSFAPHLPGAGTFRYAESLVLTKPNQESHKRSRWHLDEIFHPSKGTEMTNHRKPERWGCIEGGKCELQTVGRGQEFVISNNPDIQTWAKELVVRHSSECSRDV
jgi:hypothetical protein